MAADGPRLEKGRQALYAALDRFREQIDNDLVAEKDRNTRLLRQFLQSVKDGKYDDLMLHEPAASNSEQTTAYAMLKQTPASTTTAALAGPTLTALASSTSLNSARALEDIDVTALQADHSELRRKFNALSANFKIAKAALRKRVDERDGWASRAKHLERLISTAEKKLGIKILDPRSQSPRSPASATAHVDATALMRDASASLNKRPEDTACGPEPCLYTPTVGAEQTVSNEQAESTQGDTDDGSSEQLPQLPPAQPNYRLLIKQEPSSDEPVLVSERAVRKRKRGDSIPTTVEPRPKAEPTNDSSPILSRIHFACGTQENVDLGEIEQRIVTPRKQKEAEQPEPADHTATPRLKTSSAAPSAAPAGYKPLPQQTTLSKRPSVLTPLSVNVQKPFAISVLAEDGDAYGANPSAAKGQSPTAAPASAKSRLHTLLNSPSAVPSDSVISRPASRNWERHTASEDQSPVPERRRLPFTPPPSENRAHERSPSRKNKKKPASELRAKPLSELQLDDFKVSPLANDGHDFAFADVVRDKGERACLPGCTDLHCCGKQFKALALSQRPDPPLTPTQRMEEQKLLEVYLGDHAYRLASMSKEEKAELWVEAKTQELANKYGKHRHRFSRMQSPPGFWNADFPSTQELQEDRAEAAKRERQAVAERHREAMRPGGRWLFKDE
ncbi:DNA repair protein Sae2/CtIP [Hirsutella rhossiliensis]|uniref:DNA repair protein Sae2/CtIP n=1 Tax=Hirsutella rhossiliensis TaxID=111463 RepID=A0A9P8MQW1_9HYPO|nr:DNA repair protein Sae2/CtIP [Hirsutella rhossiliensis]KAH0959580.1 DNA repair protein Sae2/CtIP [Hirsutella rhossiliensis]